LTTAHTSSATTAELRSALKRQLHQPIVELTRTPSIYSSSFQLENLDVRLQDDSQLALLLKNLSPTAMLNTSRNVKPAFVFNPRREIDVYERILADRGLGTAALYVSNAGAQRQRYWLVLERVAGIELYQVGELAVWQAVARWLAELHASRDVRAAAFAIGDMLLEHTAAWYSRWMQRAVRFAQASGDRHRIATIEWLASRHPRVIDQLVILPQSFIHGEAYASNILVQHTDGQLRVCPIDWEMAALGPGLIDLAALSAGSWDHPARRQLEDGYRDAWRTAGGEALGQSEFDVALECCRLQLAVQWLGWAADWQSPPEHARDWLAEAVTAAERLGW
jgi:aminoglycoside phosphotransferase